MSGDAPAPEPAPAEDAVSAALAASAEGGRPVHLTLMHLLIAAASEPEARAALDRAIARAGPALRPRLDAVAALWRETPAAWTTVRTVMAQAKHDGPARPAGEAVADWARVFDALAVREPEAGVALYALGRPELLARASDEIVALLDTWGLVGRDRAVLDLGCGIGRLSSRLSDRCGLVVGADVSGGMLAQARRRCAGLTPPVFVHTSGRDLAAFASGMFDLVLAMDVFPYLFQAGDALAQAHVAEAARVLRPEGVLVVGNVSYGADPGADLRELLRWAADAGLAALGEPERPFRHWDGLVARFQKR